MTRNIDWRTVSDFGNEWSDFNQASLSEIELKQIWSVYFDIFPWDKLPKGAVGFDLGCGSGRWAKLVAPKVGALTLIDASEKAIEVAKQNLRNQTNCTFLIASVDAMPIEDETMDFGYSLGVLHHIPCTESGIKACVSKLKRGAPFLMYLYYRFDNRPVWFRALWRVSDISRKGISRLPYRLKFAVSQMVAAGVYFPLARFAKMLDCLGAKVDYLPLSIYKDRSFYVMKTDALDRFGTRLEHRFTAPEIRHMLEKAGLRNIRFSNSMPYWVAVGIKT